MEFEPELRANDASTQIKDSLKSRSYSPSHTANGSPPVSLFRFPAMFSLLQSAPCIFQCICHLKQEEKLGLYDLESFSAISLSSIAQSLALWSCSNPCQKQFNKCNNIYSMIILFWQIDEPKPDQKIPQRKYLIFFFGTHET